MGWNITNPTNLEDAISTLKLELARKIGVQQDMMVVDVGCGQGGFTAALARVVGTRGKVYAVDISSEYLKEFTERLDKHRVKNSVTFVHADAMNLKSVIATETADVTASYRLMEELDNRDSMPKILEQMVRVTRKGGKVGLVELDTETRNAAEENYVRLHRESGDCFFNRKEIIGAMNNAGLADVCVENFETDIWFSPDLAKQELSHAQVWYDTDVERRLGKLIDAHGMKYPALLIFSGMRR